MQPSPNAGPTHAGPTQAGFQFHHPEDAKVIWHGQTPQPNDWALLYREFLLDAVPEHVETVVAVDTKYWLHVNGVTVVHEGGLNRESLPEMGYCDVVDLAPFLVPGTNRISVLAWYWGNGGRNSVDSGAPGFLLSAPAIGLATDAHWQACRHPAFITADPPHPAYLYGGHDIAFDARLDPCRPDGTAFDGSALPAAVVRETTFGTMVQRPIPLFTLSDTQPYQTVKTISEGIEADTRLYGGHLPHHLHVCPALTVRARGGECIIVHTDRYTIPGGPGDDTNRYYGHKLQYVCREGEQTFTSPYWLTGETVFYRIPESVEIIRLGYRETRYDTEIAGRFHSGDPVMDTLWRKAARTLLVCMRENFMDCPDRERGQWIGDVSVQVPQVFLALDRRADALVEKAVRDFIFLRKGDVLVGNVPGIHHSELPAQSLCAIGEYGMLAEYWRYAGNTPLLSAAFEPMVAYLRCWETDERGLIQTRSGNWAWYDHLFNVDAPVLDNAWYASALRFALTMADTLDDHRFDAFLQARLQGIAHAFHDAFWQGHGYGTTTMMDERANAMAVLSGLAGKETWPAIRRVLIAVQTCTPYMERFVLEALCRMGHIGDAVRRIRQRYAEMAQSPDSTLWEDFFFFGTRNHAWSGAPLGILSRYVAGIDLDGMKDGMLRIAPSPFSLDMPSIDLEATVPTVHGPVTLKITEQGERLHVHLQAPPELILVTDFSACMLHGNAPQVTIAGSLRL